MYKINILSNILRLLATPAGLLLMGLLLLSHAVINRAAVSAIAVAAQVQPNCKFSSSNTSMSFGSYDPSDANVTAPLNTSATFTLRCSQGSSAVISLNDGLYPDGGMRRLRGGLDNYLSYNLFKDAGHSAIWNTSNTVNYVANTNQPQTFTIYGQVAAGQTNVGVGSYADTVMITVTF